jgi:hypothetical protein
MHGLANFKFIKTGLILYAVLHNPSLYLFYLSCSFRTFLIYFDLEIRYTFRRTTQKFKPFCVTKACKIIFIYMQKFFERTCCFQIHCLRLALLPWRWRHSKIFRDGRLNLLSWKQKKQICPKCWYSSFYRSYGVTFRKTVYSNLLDDSKRLGHDAVYNGK